MDTVKGVTLTERKAARAKRTTQRRANMYAAEIKKAEGEPVSQLLVAMRYLRAVVERATAEEVVELARGIARVADGWNSR